jgi:putative peptidoglycan lipid II flippase
MRVAPFDPDFARYAWLALPLIAGVTLVAADEWLDRYFGQFVGGGAIALLFFARALMQAPVGLVGQAAGTAALPALSALIERGDESAAHDLLQRVLQLTVGLAVLAGAGLFVLADPVVSLLYVRGAFGADDGAMVAALLRVFSIGIPGWVLQSVAVRGFYARGDTWRPMLLGTAILILAIPLYSLLGQQLGARGLALAGVLTISANAAATLFWARSRYAGPAVAPVLGSLLRTLAIAGLAGAAAFALVGPREGALGALVDIALGGVAFVLIAVPGIWWLGDAPARELLQRLRSRIAPG